MMTLNGELDTEEQKKCDQENKPLPTTSIMPPPSCLFGEDALNYLSNDTLSLNSFNPMDLNSADDVRQAVKSCMALKSQDQQPNRDLEPEQATPAPSKKADNTRNEEPHISKQKRRSESRTKLKVVMKERDDHEPQRKAVTRKRRGRPPKAGPSKKAKKATKTQFYNGKLSNYVRFKRRYSRKSYSSSDSDLESCLYSSS